MIDIKLFGPTVISGAGTRLVGSDLGGSNPRQLLEMLDLDLGAPGADARMDDPLEGAALLLVGEHVGAHGVPVQLTVRL